MISTMRSLMTQVPSVMRGAVAQMSRRTVVVVDMHAASLLERWQRWIYLVAVLLFIAAVTAWTVLGVFALAGVALAYTGLVRWERRRRDARWFITEVMRSTEWSITCLWILGLTEWVVLTAIMGAQ